MQIVTEPELDPGGPKNTELTLKIRTLLNGHAESDIVSFSDDEFVIGPCRSTATHDNDRK